MQKYQQHLSLGNFKLKPWYVCVCIIHTDIWNLYRHTDIYRCHRNIFFIAYFNACLPTWKYSTLVTVITLRLNILSASIHLIAFYFLPSLTLICSSLFFIVDINFFNIIYCVSDFELYLFNLIYYFESQCILK